MKLIIAIMAVALLAPAVEAQTVEGQAAQLVPVVLPQTQAARSPESIADALRNAEPFPGTQADVAPATSTPQKASFIVRAPGGWRGSGTGIAPQVVITNWHVVRESIGNRKAVFHIENPRTGVSSTATLHYWWKAHDLAILHTDDVVPYVDVADDVKHGQKTTQIGQMTGPRRGQYLAYNPRTGGQLYFDRVGGRLCAMLTSSCVGGDSGGGVFDESGRLVAVLWGATGNTYVSPLNEVVAAAKVFEKQCYPGDPNCRILRQRSGGRNVAEGPRPSVDPRPPTPPRPAVDPRPPAPVPDKYVTKVEFNTLIQQITLLTTKIDAISIQQGPPGEVGPVGPVGPTGPNGEGGSSPEIDIEAIVSEVIKRLPPVAEPQPFWIRVHPDAEFQSVYPGQYITLPIANESGE